MRLIVLCLITVAAFAQKYAGPVPPKEDLPYLLQADNLMVTEAATAQEQKGKKDEITYIISGASSSARTPLASPIFLLKLKDLVPEKLHLYKLEVKNGHREISFRNNKKAKNPEPLRLNIRRLSEGLFRLEVSDSLPNGQYSLSPDESNDVFCFEVF